MIITLNTFKLSTFKGKQVSLSITNLRGHEKIVKEPGYGVDNWLWDDQTPLYWNKDQLVLINNK